MSLQDVDVQVTVAVDVVIVGLPDPVCFTRSFKVESLIPVNRYFHLFCVQVHVFKAAERFWIPLKREFLTKAIQVCPKMPNIFQLTLMQLKYAVVASESGLLTYSLEFMRDKGAAQKDNLSTMFNRCVEFGFKLNSNIINVTSMIKSIAKQDGKATTAAEAAKDDGLSSKFNSHVDKLLLLPVDPVETASTPAPHMADEEVVVSGQGNVDRESNISLLEAWGDVLSKWDSVAPKRVSALVRKGIPHALRAHVCDKIMCLLNPSEIIILRQVWSKLAKSEANDELVAEYKTLRTKKSPSEQVRFYYV